MAVYWKPGLGRRCHLPEKMRRACWVLAAGPATAQYGGPRCRYYKREPTNHLDIPSKEMLEQACQNFDGAVIAVSHDRYFLKQIATRVLEIKDGQFVNYVHLLS